MSFLKLWLGCICLMKHLKPLLFQSCYGLLITTYRVLPFLTRYIFLCMVALSAVPLLVEESPSPLEFFLQKGILKPGNEKIRNLEMLFIWGKGE